MKRFILPKGFGIFVGILAFFLIWFILSAVIDETVMIFPSPIETIAYTGSILSKPYIYECIGITFLKMIQGFLIAFAVGIALGTLAGLYPWLKNVFMPTITVFKGIPTAALVFLFLVLFHTSGTPIVMVFLISFPVIYESFVRGMDNLDSNLMNAASVDGAGRWKAFAFVALPNLVPYILIGIASSFSLSFKIEIMSEILSGDTTSGLGSAILAAQRTNPADMRPIFAYSFIALVFIFLVSLVMKWIENRINQKQERKETANQA